MSNAATVAESFVDPVRFDPHNIKHLFKKMQEEEDNDKMQVLMELDDSNVAFVVEESNPKTHLVFRILNTLGDESTALANIAIMFRGDPTQMVDILTAFVAVKEASGDMSRIGTAMADDDDPRVLRITEWTPSVPLPLGGDLLNRLRIVVLIDGQVEPSRVKFGADLVPFPEVFLEGTPKMKRRLGQSTLRFLGGTLLEVENPVSALSTVSQTIQTTMKPPNVIAVKLPSATQQQLLALAQQAVQNGQRTSTTPPDPPRKGFWWDGNFVKSYKEL